jgi:hypothetical protein
MGIVSRALYALPLAAALYATPALSNDFVTFGNPGSAATLQWTQSTGTLQTIGSVDLSARLDLRTFGTPERFEQFDSWIPTTFTFSATQVAIPYPPLEGIFADGSFSILYAGDTPLVIDGVNYAAGTNIVSGTFANAGIDLRSTDGVFAANPWLYRDLTLTSDFLDFSGLDSTRFILPFTLANPIGTPGNPPDFTATIGSQRFGDAFLQAAVPEPGTWALLITGFGLMGVALRRRQPDAKRPGGYAGISLRRL